MRKCGYENCQIEITGRKDKKYCCRLHKQSQYKIRTIWKRRKVLELKTALLLAENCVVLFSDYNLIES